ncbi:MAG: hypothetical protein DDT19_02872 [Syntrophomonadaceae bacterium]|nr:hypothetical protein [Bacillota bacterium]
MTDLTKISNEERVHTPASMFQMLRKSLVAAEKLVFVDEKYKPEIRQIVEFTAPPRKNPIIQTMNTFVGLMDMAYYFPENHINNRRGKSIKRQMQTKKLRGRWKNFSKT